MAESVENDSRDWRFFETGSGSKTLKSVLNITELELVNMDVKKLNKLLKSKKVDREIALEIKKERRTLKNRGYAANCRFKRESECEKLEKDVIELFRTIHYQSSKTQEMAHKTRLLKEKYYELQKEVQKEITEENKTGEMKKTEEMRETEDFSDFLNQLKSQYVGLEIEKITD